MKPGDDLNNLSQVPCGAPLDSTTENNSFSSDSDMEVLGRGADDQKRVIQGLTRTLKRNRTKINDLTGKLASEKEKNLLKEEVIKSLKLSIDVINQNKDLSMKCMQNELQTVLDSSKTQNVIKDNFCQCLKDVETGQYKTKIDELNADIEILESKLKNRTNRLSELDGKAMKYESDLREKDEYIARLESQMKADATKIKEIEDKLSKFTLKAEIPSIKLITLPDTDPFEAPFEDLPSAGPNWIVIQRRMDGSVQFHGKKTFADFYCGFGDIRGEFWLGLDKLHSLTTSRRYELYIELVDFDNETAFARYDNFVIGNRSELARLKSLGDYSGNAGDFLRKAENIQFLLRASHPGNILCGWWNCECNLNGKYYDHKKTLPTPYGIWWGKRESLKSCKMLIRPKL